MLLKHNFTILNLILSKLLKDFTKKSALFFLFLFFAISLSAQVYTSISSTVPTSFTICGPAQTFTVTIYNASPHTLSNSTVQVNMPGGVNYVAGSITGATEQNITVPSVPVFSLANIPTLTTVSFTFQANVDCMILPVLNSGNPIQNLVTLSYTANGANNSESHTTNTYSIKQPNLSITSFTNQTYSGNVGDVFTRCITITNGGFGGLSQFILTDTHGTDLVIQDVNTGNWSTSGSTETIVLGPGDFALIGNGNGLLETGESITICETINITNCTSVFSNLKASWGCNGQECQEVTTTANIVFPSLTPNLQFTSSTQTNSCTGPGNLNAQEIRIINTGLGQALNVTLDIYQSTGTAFNNNMLSSIDVPSFTLQINSGAITPFSNLTVNGASSCPSGVGRVTVNIPSVEPGDSLYLRWNVSTCCATTCNSSDVYMGWRYQGNYTNICQTNYLIPNTSARSYSRLNWTLSNNGSPSSIVSGQTGAFNFLTTYFGNSYPQNANSQWKYIITLPPCLTYDPAIGNLHILHFNGIAQWNPSSINVIGNTVTAFFNGVPPFGLSQSEIKMNLTADCSVCSGGMGAITVDTYYISDSNCSCEFLVNCFSNNIDIVCPISCEGLNFQGFDIKRISYGLPDNDNDGIEDAAGTLDFSKIRRDRAMFGDTLRATYKGLIKTSFNNPDWEFGYVQGVFSGVGGAPLTGLGATLNVYRGGLLLGTAPINATTGPALTFSYDISSAVLIATGNFAPGFLYLNDDSLVLEADYRVSNNIGGVFANANCTNEFYVSNVANPASADRYSCNELQGNFSLIGYYFTNYGPNNYTVTECNQVVISQNYYLSIGPCCQNYAGGNLFPFEYRYWAHIKNLQVIKPQGYEFVSAQFRDIRTAGTLATSASAWFALTPNSTISDTFDFNVEPYFLGNTPTIPRSDDGFYGTLQVTLSPTCLLTRNINQVIRYNWEFEPGPFLVGSPTIPISNTSQDSLRYFGPDLQLQSPLPQINALTNTVSWDIIVSNIENFASQNTWISIPQNSGVTVLQVEELPGGVITPLGDFYQIGTINGASTKTFRITAEYSSCFTDSIVVNVGWNCGGYPADLTSYACTPVTITLSLVPQPAYFVSDISGPSSVDLCETVEYTVELKNVQLGSAYNVVFDLTLPGGITIVPGSSQYSYPNGSAFANIPDPVNIGGNIWQYDISSLNTTVGTNGLSGILDTLTNTYKIKFSIVTDCNYISGNWIDFLFSGETGCGMVVQDQTILAIPISQSIAYSTSIDIQTTYVKPCAVSSPFLISIKNVGPTSFGTLDSVQVILPSGVFFEPGSFVPVYNTATVNPVPGQTVVNGQQNLLWELSAGITAGDSVVFSFNYFGIPDSLQCELVTFTVNSLSTANVTCVTTNNNCNISTITGTTQIPVYVYKGNLSIVNASGFSIPNPPSGETVDLTVEINNNGDSIYASTGAYLHYYYDLNANGILDIPDIFIDTEYLGVVFPSNGNVIHNTQIDFPAGQACAILIVIDSDSTTCSCSSSEFLVVPELTNAGLDSTLCVLEQIQLGHPEINGYTYSWSPASGLNDPASANPLLTTQNTTGSTQAWQYILLTDRINCTSSDTVTIDVNPLPVISLGNDTMFCFGSPFILDAGAGFNAYQWNTGAQTQTESAASSGVYFVEVTDSNSCQNSDTIEIVVNTLPVVNLGNDTAICTGAFLTLDAGQGMTSYAWNTTEITPTIDVYSQGLYKVTVINQLGCENQDSVFVTVNPLPVLFLGNDTAICDGKTLTLEASMGMISYSWNIGEISQTIDVDTQSVYTVTVIDQNGCENSDTIFVAVNPLPVVNLGNDTAICSGFSLNLDAGTGVISYSWNTLENTQTINVDSEGLYDVTVIDLNGCQNSDSVFVTVNPLPVAELGNDTVICGYAPFLLNPGTATTYQWQDGSSNPVFPVTQSGTYSVIVTNSFNCSDTNQITIIVNPLPIVNFSSSQIEGCSPLLSLFSDSSSINSGNNIGWEWDFGDGNTASGENISNLYAYTGFYDVSLTVTSAQGCTATTTLNNHVNVYPKPTAGFIASPEEVSIFNPQIQFYNHSFGADEYFWDFNDLNYSTEFNPTHAYQDSGSFQVMLIAYNIQGCRDTTFETVRVNPEFTLFFPNAFTPDEDGDNEIFYGYGEGAVEYELRIFNRWGEEVFKSSNINTGWDGNSKGKAAPPGVYVYICYGRTFNGKAFRKDGHVTLIR